MKRYSVLFVDDLPAVREIARVYFLNTEFDMDFAAGAREGVVKLESRDYDIVICDVQMPVENGDWLKMYCDQYKPETKFFFCSAYWSRAEEEVGDFIRKPLTPEVLRTVLAGEEQEYKVRVR